MRGVEETFRTDWSRLGPVLSNPAAKVVDVDAAGEYQGLNVYGSYDPERDTSLKRMGNSARQRGGAGVGTLAIQVRFSRLSRHGPARSSTTAVSADRAVLYVVRRFPAGILAASSPLGRVNVTEGPKRGPAGSPTNLKHWTDGLPSVHPSPGNGSWAMPTATGSRMTASSFSSRGGRSPRA